MEQKPKTEELMIEARNFFDYYKKELGKSIREGISVILINFSELASFSHILSDLLLSHPEETIQILETSLHESGLINNPRVRIAELPEEFKLVLIGKWDDGYKSIVDKVIKEKKLESRVKDLGSVSYFDIPRYFRSAEIFILPSSYEGLPKVVIEALASGTKVIASGFKTDKIIPSLYFLDEISIKALAEKIIEVDAKESEYDATAKVLNEFYTWDSKAKDLEALYEKIRSA